MKRNVWILLVLTVLLLSGCGKGTDASSDWPAKKIDVQIAYTAGGTADTVNRQLAVLMSEHLGTDLNLVNVTGGSGSIAGQQVFGKAHDGYTWLGDVAHTVSGWRVLDYADLGWEDFYGFYAATSPYVLFVSGSSPYQTAEDLFDAMRDNPDMKWGTAGVGSINELTGQLMMNLIGLNGNSVPYDGGRAAAVKVVADEVAWSWCGLSDIMDLAESGDIRILGICDPETMVIDCINGTYEVPSLLVNYPELESLQGLLYWGFRVPRDTPAEVIVKIQDAFEQAVASQEWADFCESRRLEISSITGAASDEMCARLESIYAWGLYDIGMAAVNPAEFEIPRIEEFTFPANERTSSVLEWPE